MPITPHTSFRLTPEDRALLAALSEQLGVKQTEVIRLALHRLARAEKVRVLRNGQISKPA
jgi:hypothetical protein